MPLYKFRSIEEMNQHTPPARGDLADRIENLWELSAALVEIPPPRGLRKFRNMEEANAEQAAWSKERARLLRERRGLTP